MADNHRRRLLILGGTRDAATLAHQATEAFGDTLDVVSSLAGRTRPPALPGAVRVGGFGGTAGLTAFLRNDAINLLIDATHPFAQRISAHAADAACDAGIPRLSLIRPPWPLEPGGPWVDAADTAMAARMLRERGAQRVFLSTGVTDLAAFADLTDVFFLLRLLGDVPQSLPLRHVDIVHGKPPFTRSEEIALIERYDIDTMVTKNSGGALNQGKIEAVRVLGLPTIVIRRPAHPPGESVATVEDAVAWLRRTMPS